MAYFGHPPSLSVDGQSPPQHPSQQQQQPYALHPQLQHLHQLHHHQQQQQQQAASSSTSTSSSQTPPVLSSAVAAAAAAAAAASASHSASSSSSSGPFDDLAAANAAARSSMQSPGVSGRPADGAAGSGADGTAATGPRKRRRVNRACMYCHKSKVMCDDERPCSRCIKRNIAHLCRDDEFQLEHTQYNDHFSQQGEQRNSIKAQQAAQFLFPEVPVGSIGRADLVDQQQLESESAAPSVFSSAADPTQAAGAAPMDPNGHDQLFASIDLGFASTPKTELLGSADPALVLAASANQSAAAGEARPKIASGSSVRATRSFTAQFRDPFQPGVSPFFGGVLTGTSHDAGLDPAIPQDNNIKAQIASINRVDSQLAVRAPIDAGASAVARNPGKVFNYFNSLTSVRKYICERLTPEQFQAIEDLLEPVRMQIFETLLTLEYKDLVFVEEMFDRKILFYKKYFDDIGTPSCLWRRTGDVALANEAMSELVGRSGKELVSSNFYKLLSNSTLYDYIMQISIPLLSANSARTFIASVVFVRPDNTEILCKASFTVKRDVYELPLCVVGNFLPVNVTETNLLHSIRII
ncbi:hypothetical protein CAOG_09086 [Capsaspora owczarzaki ATCC 30864]|uniref:Zn(2)-C6 fungal-type domain-containing protein n=1 Tax=Capsaspora owczarzaki (strain ATCC 30864) TaxID=595528 RepID=A0A0D2WWZ2_CAPO3|nr:hypothetical protein CAOG_09086 [Capsaspora owczarzaki ATCC 30864]KJE97580.1 hypothetical protein CAOG_009086 [Capsaspora owczarzaki ATCC 30864]|eukprot:XP_011270819.1 hypothetical protein CAOG_09086 [Capsaspora owczarzaki ATCC 30864]